ncbi:T9SS type A sorting domain-containing protein [Aequorivita todarodis]|uniref:T9SS type A sorting domain-containing protein n=1 Tax=Aequorivita todarodis TaxID=2036821 RepID=UPI002350BC05|nr:T9SS type A sorting domain-containing protein [Aequorivita todarodis]MDC8001442.1 T9SS type A sorting domain-containing protein [Aequorivita todarodis]
MRSYFSILLCFLCIVASAQFGPQQVITTEAIGVELVIAVDIDGDGDMDIASASRGSDTIAWQENLDGLGAFGPQQMITTSLDQTVYVAAADLDGDWDMDILGISGFGDLVVWFENLDGLGSFSPQRIIDASTILPSEIITADIDGDGDEDVVVSSRGENAIIWFENTNGLGDFGPKQVVTNSALSGFSVYASDLDGDLDIDLVATSSGNKRLYWYENLDGLGTFGPDQLIVETSDFGGFVSVFAIDIDGDDDNDVLAAEFGGDRLSWFENTDGLATFGPQQIITSTLITPYMVFSIDLDNDGDVDVLSASGTDDKVVWFENTDGLGTFSTEKVITTLTDNPRSVYAADIDNDGDNDVLSASIADYKIAWYENLTVLNVSENPSVGIAVHPNPVTDILNITSPLVIYSVEVYNIGSQLIERNSYHQQSVAIDYSKYSSGIYIIKVISDTNIQVVKIVKK